MKSSIIRQLFLNNNGRNFRINTDIAKGHGINGVSFGSYTGVAKSKKDYSTETYVSSTTVVTELTDEYITLDIYDVNGYPSFYSVTIGLENIVSIQFFQKEEYYYPLEIDKNPLFEPKE